MQSYFRSCFIWDAQIRVEISRNSDNPQDPLNLKAPPPSGAGLEKDRGLATKDLSKPWKRKFPESASKDCPYPEEINKSSDLHFEIILGIRPMILHEPNDPEVFGILLIYRDYEVKKTELGSRDMTTTNHQAVSLDRASIHNLVAAYLIEPGRIRALSQRYSLRQATGPLLLDHGSHRSSELPQRKFKTAEFRKRWLAATEHAARSALAEQYGISDLDSLKIVGETWANPIPLAALCERLDLLVKTSLFCMVEITNSDQTRVHNGRLVQAGLLNASLTIAGENWYSSIKVSEIGGVWLVGNPVSRRIEHSVEVFDRSGRTLIRISGTPESLENAIWQDMLGTLPTLS